MANILDGVAAGMQANIPQLASDLQMGPSNSVSCSSVPNSSAGCLDSARTRLCQWQWAQH